MEIKFKKIHAFTDGSSIGNPAGYVFDEYGLTEQQMQQLAAELEGVVSEVVYLKQGNGVVDYNLRYFSCEREVAFCGHGTLAVISDELKNKPEIAEKKSIIIQTQKGVLEVENDTATKAVYIEAPKPEYIACEINAGQLSEALNIDESCVDTTRPIEVVNAGLNTLLVPLVSADAVIDCQPDYKMIREFCFHNNCDIVNIFSSSTVKEENDFRTRIFAPTFGYLEDPATGSGNSALGCYLIKHDLWKGGSLVIEQGVSRDNPNYIYLKKSADNAAQVLFGGKSVVKLAGTYYL